MPAIRATLALLLYLAGTAPGAAAMISRLGDADVCQLMSAIGREAAILRQAGIGQREAARRASDAIGRLLSDRPGDAAERQRLATLIGAEATGILRLVYSVPVGRSDAEKAQWVISGERYVYGYCMGTLN